MQSQKPPVLIHCLFFDTRNHFFSSSLGYSLLVAAWTTAKVIKINARIGYTPVLDTAASEKGSFKGVRVPFL